MLGYDELKDDEGPSNILEHFIEFKQLLQMIENVKPCDAKEFEKDYELYTEILARYQEQPHLLDPHLEELLICLLKKVRNLNASEMEVHAVFKYLYIICKVRTHKVLVKFLPHELCDLEYALDLLERQDPKEHQHWETRYMLLLWLSILVLNPFHMTRLDVYTSNHTFENSKSHLKSKMERIYDLCKIYSTTNDTCSNIAAYLSAKYLVRADTKEVFLSNFFDYVMSHHSTDTIDVKFGQLASIASILKHGKREDLLPYARKLLQWIISCQYNDNSNFLKYKNYLKIVQRIGLVLLKPRVANWRYKRGTRCLAGNLDQTFMFREISNNENTLDENDGNNNEEVNSPDAIEEIIEVLLEALRSSGCDIRWSAAKGIGRVTNRLPKDFADEIIGSVIDILNPLEPHEAWHGACLALAELAKRGLLLPHRFKELIPLLTQALFYDEMKGYMSVGQHIRDAACYMCWAFARAYDPEDLQPFVQEISSGLLTVAVFDREINCRRAASAAFQESVGRLGNFPYGIEISTTTDFYSVGSRQNTYLNISNFIAQYEEYKKPLINHLIERKVGHWDTTIRELTAKALHNLTSHSPEFMTSKVLSDLFVKTDSIDINTRHGSILAIGEIVLALHKIEKTSGKKSYLISNQITNELNGLIRKFLVRDLFKGMSGEIMKECCTDFIRNCSLAHIETTIECLENWELVINRSIVNKSSSVRESAIAALGELCSTYYNHSDRSLKNSEMIRSYVKGADNSKEEHIRMGYLSALGVLPKFMVSQDLEEILECLIKHSLVPSHKPISSETPNDNETVVGCKWSEARRCSVDALLKLVQTVGYDNSTQITFANQNYYNRVICCLLKAMDEYTLDNRGDIGAWVREAAMTALFQLITTSPKNLLQPDHVHKTVLGFAQQSVEKIDRTRGLAGRLFCDLINFVPQIPHICHHERVKQIFPEDSASVLWLFADHTFPIFCSLLEFPEYSKRLLLGLSASIGQLTESLIKNSSNALFDFFRSHPTEVPRLCQEIIVNFEESLLNERITYPMINFIDILISSGSVNCVLLDENSLFADNIYRLLNIEIKGYRKLYKLISSINVYCQLLQVPWLSKKIISKMSIFLGLTHVHVRKTAGTKLYEAMALHGDVCGLSEETMDQVLNTLLDTDWGLPLVEIRPIRNELCKIIGIKPPISGIASN